MLHEVLELNHYGYIRMLIVQIKAVMDDVHMPSDTVIMQQICIEATLIAPIWGRNKNIVDGRRYKHLWDLLARHCL